MILIQAYLRMISLRFHEYILASDVTKKKPNRMSVIGDMTQPGWNKYCWYIVYSDTDPLVSCTRRRNNSSATERNPMDDGDDGPQGFLVYAYCFIVPHLLLAYVK
jgi:hypothetical protein